jgi:two-component system, NarL family, nitrate/nitrite response regulator NarL
MEYIDKAVVVDSNPIYREGLVKVLSEALSVDCLGFASLDLMLGSTTGECERALLLLDFGGNCVIAANCIGHLRNKFPQSLVVVMSELYNDDHILCAFRSGARGYILKKTNCEAIIKSIQLICLGERVYPSQLVEALSSAEPHDALGMRIANQFLDVLSPREVEVLGVLCEGQSNKLIARRCGITEATVKVHVKAILRKLKARNRTEAAVWAHDHKLSLNGVPGLDVGGGVTALGGGRP